MCLVCAWREMCQKKYRISKTGALNCPDFVRDLRLPRGEDDKQGEASNEPGPDQGAKK